MDAKDLYEEIYIQHYWDKSWGGTRGRQASNL